MPRLFRIQFGVRHLLLLILVTALVSALIFREFRFQAETAALRNELEQSQGVLQAHGLAWQLDDLKKDHIRISVMDYAPVERGSNVRNPNFFAQKATITSIGPARVYLVDNSDPSAQPRLICAIDANADEAASASISMFAHYVKVSAEGGARLDYSIDISANGSASGTSYLEAVAVGKQLPELLQYKLTSGDYPRGEPIEFYRRLVGESGGEFHLLVE